MEPTRVPLTALDEAFLHLSAVRWSVQYEVRVQGRLDVGRLRSAFAAACATHPIGRASLADPAGWSDRRLFWEIADEPVPVPIDEFDGTDPDVLAAARAELYDQPPTLTEAPPVRAAIAHDDAGDLLMLVLHHAAFDGISAVRFTESVARAYAGAPDPTAGPPFAEARDLRRLAGSQTVGQQLRRAGGVADEVLARRQPIVRIHPAGGAPGPLRFGVTTLLLDERETAELVAAKPPGTTVNDLLLAALLLTVRRWNAEHGDAAIDRGGERVTAMMAVNLRAPEWSNDVCANFASYLPIPLPPGVPDDLAVATLAVAERTRRHKERRNAGWLVDLLRPTNLLPVPLKERLLALIPQLADIALESTALSNLGRLAPLDFGDAGQATEVWFSPPAHAPLHVAVGAATLDGRLFLTLRYLSEVFDADGAASFAKGLRDCVVEASVVGPSRVGPSRAE